ncbi:hypothetical protein FK530_19175 [Tsukamurella conjunctivitidis]|uniref:Minor tail protein n=1 Tax=Tsukamurella conjunctivitidis TaxID=2592068 RepID=A0A5C5RXW1_9ACTN|nr:hypothetical protein [Tsukamurella conjunctivitidis]TWS27270.1 hypothetical protein FK530_19175 [Tsukamurella conjunctivitidis]
MSASMEVRGTAVTHDPNLRLDSSLGKLPAFDPIKLLEGFIDMFIEVMEDIPILGDLVKVLKELLDTNGNGHLELEDLLGLLTGRGILDGLAALFGGNNGLPFGDIFAGLQQMFGGLTPGGKFDAGELIGDLPMAIVNTLRGLISAVFDLGLLRITPNMIFGGNSDNLLLASDFKAAESMVVGDGWFWDGVEGRTAPGSAKATASGNRLVQLSNLVRVEEGQKIDVAGWVKWSGVSASGDAFRVECQCYNGASSAASLPVGVISSPAASGGWQQINGQVTVPASVDGVRVRIAVEAAVTAGSVWWDDVTAVRVGTMPQNFITNLVPDLANLFSWLENLIDSILDRLDIPIIGDLLDKIFDVADGVGNIRADADDTKADLTDLLGDLLSNPASVLGALPQTLISGLVSRLAGIDDFVQDLVDAILRAIRGIPIVGGTLADIIAEIGGLNDRAVTAQETAEQTAQDVVDGWTGTGSSTGGVYDTMQAIKTAIAAGYTVDTITSNVTWTRPDRLTELAAVAIGSGQNGASGSTTILQFLDGVYGTGESPGGQGGGFAARSFDPSEIPATVNCTIGVNGGEVAFGALMSTVRGEGNMAIGSMGFAPSTSIAGDGGRGGKGRGTTNSSAISGLPGAPGVRSVVAAGGTAGAGGTNPPGGGDGGSGAPASITSSVKCGAGGGGGGGGGGELSNGTRGVGGAGGPGGFPGGGGGGGGGGGVTGTTELNGSVAAGGPGGLGGGGILFLIYKQAVE